MPDPITDRGRQSKARIVSAAARLMYQRGVTATSLDDILAASGTGKSQFYHYFTDKDALIEEVLVHQLEGILEDQSHVELDSWNGIVSWFETMIKLHGIHRHWQGCPLGSIAAQAVAQGEPLRLSAAKAFARWESALADALEAMRGRGELDSRADPSALAETVIAIVEGGYLLSSIKHDDRPMRGALQAGLDYLKSYSPSPAA